MRCCARITNLSASAAVIVGAVSTVLAAIKFIPNKLVAPLASTTGLTCAIAIALYIYNKRQATRIAPLDDDLVVNGIPDVNLPPSEEEKIVQSRSSCVIA